MEQVNPLVSVVIPTYKRESDYLLRAINSILKQTYKNIEIIIIDDNIPGSKERYNTEQFMRTFSNNQSLRYIKNERNMGGSLSRNRGIETANGDYITFLDDDDEYLPEKIQRQLDFMLKNKYDMTFTNLALVNNQKVIVDYREYKDLKDFDSHSLLKYHIMKHLTGTPTFMYRAQCLRDIGGFDDAKMGQEFYLMLKTIESGLNIGYYADSYVLAYRHNAGGISQGKNKIVGEKALYSFKKNYFKIFTFRERMFIRFRHYAVMLVAHKRNKSWMLMCWYAWLMFLASPIDVVKEGINYMKRLNNQRKRAIQ